MQLEFARYSQGCTVESGLSVRSDTRQLPARLRAVRVLKKTPEDPAEGAVARSCAGDESGEVV